MRNFIVLILAVLCLTHGVAHAKTRLDFLPTYRQDRFTWNKAGLNDYPNVLSELKMGESADTGRQGRIAARHGAALFSGSHRQCWLDIFRQQSGFRL